MSGNRALFSDEGRSQPRRNRFFLALLLNVTNREKVLELVQQRYPNQEPVETILDWVEELGRTRVWDQKKRTRWECPNLMTPTFSYLSVYSRD